MLQNTYYNSLKFSWKKEPCHKHSSERGSFLTYNCYCRIALQLANVVFLYVNETLTWVKSTVSNATIKLELLERRIRLALHVHVSDTASLVRGPKQVCQSCLFIADHAFHVGKRITYAFSAHFYFLYEPWTCM